MGDRDTAVQFYNAAVTSYNERDKNPDNLQLSYQLFTSACLTDPTWAEAFYQVGNNNSDLNLLHASVANYRRVLELPDVNLELKGKVLCNMGWRLHSLGQNEEALKACKAALEIDPNLCFAWLNLSLIYGAYKQTERSVDCARKAHALEPDNPTVEMALAFALLFARKFSEGLKHFEARFPYKFQNFLYYPYPKWRGEEGKVVFLVADQGLGDTLSYARFLEAACQRAKHIYASIQPELMRLFGTSFAHLSDRLTLLPMPTPFPSADHWTTFVSLPYALNLTDKEFREAPHITIPRFPSPAPWKLSDRKLHVGISFAGSALNEINKHRSIPVGQFADLYRCPGIQLYSLQVSEEHKHVTEQGFGAIMPDLKPYIRDVADTYSVLAELDMVITIESALGHIAGMIDMPTFIPYSYQGRDYRIGHTGDDVIWYKNHHIFPQGPDLNWAPVFERMVRRLKNMVSLKAAA